MKSILFITTSTLTTNPRLVKETEIAYTKGYSVTILCFSLGGWSEPIDNNWMIDRPDIKVYKIPAQRKPIFNWAISTLSERICKIVYPIFPNSTFINAFASNKRSFLIHNFLNDQLADNNYQLIIAHNLGALLPAYQFAKRKRVPFIFDVEDYHPGENIEGNNKPEKLRREFLLKKMLPKAGGVTFASPLIGKAVLDLVGQQNILKHSLINNCFSEKEFSYPIDNSLDQNKIHFVWFSQNIAANRGLEIIIPALAKVKDKVHLHLTGNLYTEFAQQWINPNLDFVSVYKPLSQPELNQFICKFDVGLAIELSTADENRQICLTNKIWAYLQSGLYIMATNTPAQIAFMKEYPAHGLVFGTNEQPNETTNISEALSNIINSIDSIRRLKQERFEKAKTVSWENESPKLFEMWEISD